MKRTFTLVTICLLLFSIFPLLTPRVTGWWIDLHESMTADTLAGLGWPEEEIGSGLTSVPAYASLVDLVSPHLVSSCHRVRDFQDMFERCGGTNCSFPGAECYASDFIQGAHDAYAAGNTDVGRRFLGYAIHYIQDAMCPPHVFPFSEHQWDLAHNDFETYTYAWYGTFGQDQGACARVSGAVEIPIESAGDLLQKINDSAHEIYNRFDPPPPGFGYVCQNGTRIGDLSDTIVGWKMSDDDIGWCMVKAASLVKGAAAWANPYATMQTCYIRADGSLDPPTVPVERNGSVYTFTNNSFRSIVVERDDIVVDGAQSVLQGTSLPNSVAIEIRGRHNVTIENLEIRSFDIGVFLSTSSDIKIINNRFLEDGIFLSNTPTNEGMLFFNTHTIEGNTLNGKPIYYYKNTDGMTVPTDAGSVLLANCTNFNVQNLNASSGTVGIELAYTSNSTISNNEATNKWYGLYLHYASGNFISNNNASNNIVGVYLDCCNNNGVFDNNFSDNFCGIRLGMGSVYNSISRNLVSNSWYGTYISDSSDNNEIIHNNFLHNQYQISRESANSWDEGYTSGGNYWSDYNGTDLLSGSGQNETGTDGIGDTPYVIDPNNRDNYPLMKPYAGPHDIGITYAATSKTGSLPMQTVGQGYCVNVTAKVLNYGEQSEIFNVTVYADTTAINQTQVTLTSRNSTIMTFTINTAGLAYGNYTISAYAWPLLNETDTADNWLVGGHITVTIPGDLNGDFTVDIYDAIRLSNAFNSTPVKANWNPNADINSDNIVDIYDAIILSNNFNQHYP